MQVVRALKGSDVGRKGKKGGHSCLPFDKARHRVFIRFESEGVTIYATQGKE